LLTKPNATRPLSHNHPFQTTPTAEHLARTRAEDAAADAVARLTVAQVQLAEYAEARAEQAAEAARAARAALEAVAGTGAGADNAALSALCASLDEASQEATAFATQQRADADRLQRSTEGAGGGGGSGGGGAAAPGAAAADGGAAAGPSAAAAAGEGEAAAAAGDKQRRSTTGGKRRSGGAGSADPKRRGSANGRAAAAGADGGGNKDDDSLHSAISEPTSSGGGAGAKGAATTSTTTTTTSSDNGSSSSSDSDDDNRAPNAFRRRDLARAQRALAAAADPQDALVSVRDRARHVPLRLKLEDRRLLRLLEAALQVSEYVDRVDVLTWRSRASRASAQVRDLCAILSGLVVAQDYRAGQRLVQDRDFAANAAFFQDVSLGCLGGCLVSLVFFCARPHLSSAHPLTPSKKQNPNPKNQTNNNRPSRSDAATRS
jgi:hypothetical protein